jgi:hypothetical protein
MKILYGQEFLMSILQPGFRIIPMAFRTTSIPAGMVGVYLVAAVVTGIEMAAQSRRTAMEYILESATMAGRQLLAVLIQIRSAIPTKNICHFQHNGSPDPSQRSVMRLLTARCTACIVLCVKWR